MGDFLWTDVGSERPTLDHPDSAIRLACAVHRFKVPRICGSSQVQFKTSFYTVSTSSTNNKTRKLMLNADDARSSLGEALDLPKISSERICMDSKRYQPLINSILLSCKVQPEEARLDERLVFNWKSGVESDGVSYQSEAIMYDLVMTVVSEGLGRAAAATEASVGGDFSQASREYATASGIFQYLADDMVPKWISKGSNVDDKTLPCECSSHFSRALSQLFYTNGQQMAVATLLIKPGTPNYSLLAKLCFGISESLEDFVAKLRRHAFNQMARLDPEFFTLVSFQIAVQKSLCLYFQARDEWNKMEYGIAIALLSEATTALKTRTGDKASTTAAAVGVPEISPTSPLRVLKSDLDDLRQHMSECLKTWESDNNSVFYSTVPQHVPAGHKLQEGYQMKKQTKYELEPAEPVLLKLPEDGSVTAKKPPSRPSVDRSDSDLARELQERLNAGLDG